MGNWLKGRAFINDLSLIGDNNSANTTTATTTRLDIQSNTIRHGPTQIYHNVTNSQSSQLASPHSHQQSLPLYNQSNYNHNNSSLLVSQFSEEEQIQLAKRIGLIQHLPTGIYDTGGESRSTRECVICMIEFSKGDSIRFLPCLHTYHVHCIDDWLMRSFICPSCMEPVDVALHNIF